MFSSLLSIPADPLFGLQKEFQACVNPNKINLGIGIYFETKGNPFVMPSVQKTCLRLEYSNNNYVAMRGDEKFLSSVQSLLLGNGDFASVQTVGGTHGVWVINELLHRVQKNPTVYIPTPTWANHYALLGGSNIISFSHIIQNDKGIHFAHENYIHALQNAPDGSILLLHGGKTHNPTGVNASLEQLEEIIDLANAKKIFLLVDYAYFGMGDGFEEDKKYATIFAEKANHCALVFSFSKNATLYKHRLGAVFVKDIDSSADIINQNLENIVRESISNPPAFGAMVMQDIFDTSLEEWKKELEIMRETLEQRRLALLSATQEKFPHLANSRGMFTLLGISPEQVTFLKNEYGIFLPSSGRINFGGLYPEDIPLVAEALNHVISKM